MVVSAKAGLTSKIKLRLNCFKSFSSLATRTYKVKLELKCEAIVDLFQADECLPTCLYCSYTAFTSLSILMVDH
jgi:hypothetical protein